MVLRTITSSASMERSAKPPAAVCAMVELHAARWLRRSCAMNNAETAVQKNTVARSLQGFAGQVAFDNATHRRLPCQQISVTHHPRRLQHLQPPR